VKRLQEADDDATRLAAVRALAAIGPLAAQAEPALNEIMRGDDQKLTVAAVVAINRLHPESPGPAGTQALSAWLSDLPGAPAFDETAIEQEERALFTPRDGFGGGGRGGQGGGFF
jgi:hypothetical protein